MIGWGSLIRKLNQRWKMADRTAIQNRYFLKPAYVKNVKPMGMTSGNTRCWRATTIPSGSPRYICLLLVSSRNPANSKNPGSSYWISTGTQVRNNIPETWLRCWVIEIEHTSPKGGQAGNSQEIWLQLILVGCFDKIHVLNRKTSFFSNILHRSFSRTSYLLHIQVAT